MAKLTRNDLKQFYNLFPIHKHSFWCISLTKSLGLFAICGLIITFTCFGMLFCFYELRLKYIKAEHRNFYKAWWGFNMLFSLAASTILFLVWVKAIKNPEKQNKCLKVYFWLYFAMIVAHFPYIIAISVECAHYCTYTIWMHMCLYFLGILSIIYSIIVVNSYRRIYLEQDQEKGP